MHGTKGPLKCGKTEVKQHFKNEVDINTIMRRYVKNGTLPQMIRDNAAYGDFSNVPSYHEAQNIIIKATEQFNALDVDVRKRFKNDPAEMLAFVSDPANKEEMYKLGLAIKPTNVVDSTPIINDDKTTTNSEVNNEVIKKETK